MKQSEFFNALRKVIREEVRSIVKEEITSALKSTLVEAKTVKPQVPVQRVKPKIAAPQPKSKPSFDGPLASVLKETYEHMLANPQAEADDEWPDLGGKIMQSDDALGFGMLAGGASQQAPPVQPAAVSHTFSGDPTAGLMKDYSSLMKKADSIAQGFR